MYRWVVQENYPECDSQSTTKSTSKPRKSSKRKSTELDAVPYTPPPAKPSRQPLKEDSSKQNQQVVEKQETPPTFTFKKTKTNLRKRRQSRERVEVEEAKQGEIDKLVRYYRTVDKAELDFA